jgi:hypothetical protein
LVATLFGCLLGWILVTRKLSVSLYVFRATSLQDQDEIILLMNLSRKALICVNYQIEEPHPFFAELHNTIAGFFSGSLCTW